jgi:hypothetical protein
MIDNFCFDTSRVPVPHSAYHDRGGTVTVQFFYQTFPLLSSYRIVKFICGFTINTSLLIFTLLVGRNLVTYFFLRSLLVELRSLREYRPSLSKCSIDILMTLLTTVTI